METRDITYRSFDSARFTPAELKLIYSSVSNYADDPRITDIKCVVLDKIQQELYWRQSVKYQVSTLNKLNTDSNGAIDIRINTDTSNSLFKIVTAPEVIGLRTIIGSNLMPGAVIPEALIWKDDYYTVNKKLRGSIQLLYPQEEGKDALSITIPDLLLELIYAFYTYHTLDGRSVDISGLPFVYEETTEKNAEGAPEGEETSSPVLT